MLPLTIAPNVQQAIASQAPVVALESTVIAHGLPAPRNCEVALACEAAVRARGATPATIAVLDGRIVIGCDADQIDFIARGTDIAKVSRPDLAAVIARRGNGATTVAGTLLCAAAAGIRVMATGGIGGVHRGGETSMDVSADLQELARAPLAVVCAGAKSILDLGRTLEVLETNGVPVAGFRTGHFPAFYTQKSGHPVAIRVDTATEAADLIAAHQSIPNAGGIVIANPVPAAAAIPSQDVDKWILTALTEAQESGVSGKELTPFLLSALARLSNGATLEANIALLENNAGVAAEIAVALHAA
jgi:pseudouridine-5'-phosphate glycosidase